MIGMGGITLGRARETKNIFFEKLTIGRDRQKPSGSDWDWGGQRGREGNAEWRRRRHK